MSTKTGNDLFIVDNSDDDWKVLSYLAEWSEISSRFDIATGYFEIGSLLALDGKWQKLDQIRILMGDEVTKRTQRALIDGTARVKGQLDDSIEREKLKNDFLLGVPAIDEAIEANGGWPGEGKDNAQCAFSQNHPPPDAATLAAEQSAQKEQLKAQKKAAASKKKSAAVGTGLFGADFDLQDLTDAAGADGANT